MPPIHAPSTGDPVKDLLDLLDLETLDVNLFRGLSPDEPLPRVFGGQVVAQALTAAYRTVEGRVCHSLHAYFIRPGDSKTPILYEVDRSRDGKSFATRRVVAIQRGEQIFNLAASFQTPEPGFEHQTPMPDTPDPDVLQSEIELRKAVAPLLPKEFAEHFARPRPIEVRPVNPVEMLNPAPAPPHKQMWLRAAARLPDDPALHQCVLAYASDMGILDTAARPHGVTWFTGRAQMASLDHAMWFHHDFRADDWLLYDMDAPSSSGARGFTRGEVFTREGKLVASVTQEGLIRPRTPRKPA